jgi:hypothetical protein
MVLGESCVPAVLVAAVLVVVATALGSNVVPVAALGSVDPCVDELVELVEPLLAENVF